MKRTSFFKKALLWVLPVLALFALAFLALRLLNPGKTFTLPGAPDPALKGKTAQVHVLDVGQADCTLLLQGRAAALIDTGTTHDADLITAFLKEKGVRRLELLVLTHFHADHIGGALQLLEEFPVETVLLPDLDLGPMPTSATALRLLEKLADLADRGRTAVLVPGAGDSFALGKGQLTVIGAGIPCSDDLNNTSLVTLFTFDNFSFYSGGDTEADAESALLAAAGPDLHADLYKVSHHGSYTSNSPALVQQLAPQAAIVSCGFDNDYGHPHFATLNTLDIAGVALWRTDLHGSVAVLVKDGQMTVRGERKG